MNNIVARPTSAIALDYIKGLGAGASFRLAQLQTGINKTYPEVTKGALDQFIRSLHERGALKVEQTSGGKFYRVTTKIEDITTRNKYTSHSRPLKKGPIALPPAEKLIPHPPVDEKKVLHSLADLAALIKQPTDDTGEQPAPPVVDETLPFDTPPQLVTPTDAEPLPPATVGQQEFVLGSLTALSDRLLQLASDFDGLKAHVASVAKPKQLSDYTNRQIALEMARRLNKE